MIVNSTTKRISDCVAPFRLSAAPSRLSAAPSQLAMNQAHFIRRSFRSFIGRWSCVLALTVATASLSACQKGPESPQESFQELREDAAASKNSDEVASWLLAELLRPGGKPESAKKARAHLDSLKEQGVLSHIARALDDAEHGRSKKAAEEYFAALLKARTWDDPRASLFGWFAALRVQETANVSLDFDKKHSKQIAEILKDPGKIGFRAYAIVVDLWAEEAFSKAEEDIDEKLARKLGCVESIALAGPFGTNPATDILRSFPAENPGVWPTKFPTEEGQARSPRRLQTDSGGCDVMADEPTESGVFYAESFLELKQSEDIVLSASGATQIWVNDTLVLERDVRIWGIWPKFATRVQLPPGRHRVLWKIGDPATALRAVRPNGQPVQLESSIDASRGYSLVPPIIAPDPNDLMRYITPTGVKAPEDDLTRYVAAYLAGDEGQPDVAAIMFEPFVEKPELATGVSLSTAAYYVNGDPIYDETQTRDLVHELELRAAEKDAGLWYPIYRNIIWEAQQKGATTVIDDLEKLATRFPEVATIHFSLTELYDNLDWGAEYERSVLELLERFPDDENALKLGVDLYEAEGDQKKVEELLDRILSLNPDSELLVARALNQKQYGEALKELKRLQARRPSRKDIASRIEAILIRSGDEQRTFETLQKAIEREPKDVHSRLALADAQIASEKFGSSTGGDKALSMALVEAIQAGADPSPIEGAIDLVEGLTALEPYRIDGKKVIADYEASDKHLPGTAARVLDYGAVWIRGDGSSRFLEHEIVRIQSEEGIKRFTEAQTYGLVLHMRVIKKDGTILEPEEVAGKPTVTMPHLEIGDYIETERIVSRWGDGIGLEYSGPGWYFREKDVAYARSEFVVIAPVDKELILETHNGVPAPEVTRNGSVVVHRYRVDESPAAPDEPLSPPAQEFLPRVQVGWGMSFDRRIRNISRSMISLTATDPRLVRIAENITAGKTTQDEKLHAIYHWILDNVQDGEEGDGRRVVVSRSGNLWRGFQTLCQALNIPVSWALAESSLASPEEGPIAVAERSLHPLLVVGKGKNRHWLTIEDKFAPFGTVPSHLRGEPAFILGGLEAEATKVPSDGVPDGIHYEGTGKLLKNGSAELDFKIIFLGTFATSLRTGLSQIPENQLGNIIESQLLGQQLQGAQLKNYKVQNQNELDKPLIIQVEANVPQFASPSGVGLLVSPPFMPRLTQLTPLAERTTPLLIGQESITGVDITLSLPEGITAQVKPHQGKSSNSTYQVEDTAQKGSLRIKRNISTLAGRISPENYRKFQQYTNDADASLSAAIRLSEK